MAGALKDGYRGLIRATRPRNEVMRANMQGKTGGRKPLVDKKQMYTMRYDMQFHGLSVNQVAKKYNLPAGYVGDNVYNYRTMSLVIPVKSIKPEEYEG